MDRHTISELAEAVAHAVEEGCAGEDPFLHLTFSRVFPDEIYAQMVRHLPGLTGYRGMSGRAKESDRDGKPTRVKLDLLPEHLDCLPGEQRRFWAGIGTALRAPEVRAALMRRLAPALAQRFGNGSGQPRLFPVPALFRDTPGYFIPAHTDTHWKGITVQFYLPTDDASAHVGTVFHRVLPDGRRERAVQMAFVPNSGYAFAVGRESWHSVDPVGPEVTSRDSILLTYFVDDGWLRFFRNRAKRAGNLILHRMERPFRRVA